MKGRDIERHNEEQLDYYDRERVDNLVPRKSAYLIRHVEEMIRFAGLTRPERVLEVGCGMGRYTLPLAEMGYAVEGLDISATLLQRLRDFEGGPGVPLHNCDILDYPSELEGKFDAVVGFFALHHLHELEESFRSMGGLLKPGGRIAFLEPNAYNALFYVQMAITRGMSWRGDGGVARMRRSVVLGAMERAGFSRTTLERFGFFPPFIADRPTGARVERLLERVPGFNPILPFQLFRGDFA